ncbi:MAG: DUF1792 domain-containing protein [Firmicutes bacterium]|nr:DUF1792 domain-containing protein [Bacillota bacterium]
MIKLIKKINTKLKYMFNYSVANTIFRKKIEMGDNSFIIMDDKRLVDEIVYSKKSFSRFGDGELSLILNDKFNLSFQKNSEELRNALKKVLNSDLKNLIIGINISFNNSDMYSKKTQRYFRTFNYMYREKYKSIIPQNKEYGNSSITRFYMDYDHNNTEAAFERLNNLKRIWNNRSILIVEGIHSKLGVGNDLFNNATKIKRLLVPEANAFDKIKEIDCKIKELAREDDLILLAVGPTATIIAYDVAEMGLQAVDIGHIDIEYEWLRMNSKKRVAVLGKYVNEAKGKKYIENPEENEEYKKSIIYKID